MNRDLYLSNALCKFTCHALTNDLHFTVQLTFIQSKYNLFKLYYNNHKSYSAQSKPVFVSTTIVSVNSLLSLMFLSLIHTLLLVLFMNGIHNDIFVATIYHFAAVKWFMFSS